MISNFSNVLVLAPHTDDGELGCGATIAKLIDDGANVHYMAFSSAEESLIQMGLDKDMLANEVKEATKVLGIKKENLHIYNYPVRKLNFARQDILEDMIKFRRENKIDLVLMPSLNDIHQDHSTVSQEGLRAFKNMTIFGYELIWNNLSFDTTAFVKLDKKYIQQKVDALNKYKSQEGRVYMSDEFIFSLAKTRGVQISSDYAESFEVVRLVME